MTASAYSKNGDDLYIKMKNIAFSRYHIVESIYGAHTIMIERMTGRVVK